MKSNIFEELKQIIENNNSTRQERVLAMCLLQLHTEVITLKRLNKIQLTLLISIITTLISLLIVKL